MQDIEDFDYFFLIEDDVSLIYREIKRVTYKATLNKILKYTNYTNKVMCKFVNNTLKQIHFLFEKYL